MSPLYIDQHSARTASIVTKVVPCEVSFISPWPHSHVVHKADRRKRWQGSNNGIRISLCQSIIGDMKNTRSRTNFPGSSILNYFLTDLTVEYLCRQMSRRCQQVECLWKCHWYQHRQRTADTRA